MQTWSFDAFANLHNVGFLASQRILNWVYWFLPFRWFLVHKETPHLSNSRTLQGSSGASHLLEQQFDDTQRDCEQGDSRDRLRGGSQGDPGVGTVRQQHHTYGLRNDQQYFHPGSRPNDRREAGPTPESPGIWPKAPKVLEYLSWSQKPTQSWTSAPRVKTNSTL
jgi:hypothetical protein